MRKCKECEENARLLAMSGSREAKHLGIIEQQTREIEKLKFHLREILKLIDAGDCNSGGDYHNSKLGRHCDKDGGKLTCPACRIRSIL